ncbi:putative origin recognition complex subunit 6 [Rosellinia necatrix]|uniref:Putative origin recognition complex subunit 6 n=1 Tax=Rosellinia necatrix TaxID=77044 RepID=A0A1W2TK36_ROSNE|nr:putative origin recognition complex subunit 6 [Rosellinia necatrix]
MSRTLEPTLYSLLPSHSTALPQSLLELASSLLAQSRHSAGTLKADEEVARSYVCAHIACERLKISLDLPPIQVRPPIPPRLYKRLYSHLDNVLPSTSVSKSGRTRTPTSKAKDAGLFGSTQRVPSRVTPTKDSSLAKYRSPTTAKGDATPTKSASKPPLIPAKRKAGGIASTLPAWIRPTIQLLCKELDQELVGRTVLAGMQTIVAPHGRQTNDQWINDHLTPLLAAIYCLVSGQLYVLVHGKDLNNRQYSKIRKSILGVLEQAQEKVAVKTMDEDELWIGWSDITSKDVDTAMAEIIKRGWQEDEWFNGFEEVVRRSLPDANNANDDADKTGDAGISEKLHIQRADTMFQSRWDMTDQKRREYREWKDGILEQIEEIERSQATDIEVGSTT